MYRRNHGNRPITVLAWPNRTVLGLNKYNNIFDGHKFCVDFKQERHLTQSRDFPLILAGFHCECNLCRCLILTYTFAFNKREQCADRKCPRLRVLGTTLQPQGKEPGQRDTTKNHGRLGGIRQTPGHLPKQPCHLPEETGVLPAMTYGAETWTLTKQAQNKLAAAHTKMERSMLNITYKDRKTNIWVRERTKS